MIQVASSSRRSKVSDISYPMFIEPTIALDLIITLILVL